MDDSTIITLFFGTLTFSSFIFYIVQQHRVIEKLKKENEAAVKKNEILKENNHEEYSQRDLGKIREFLSNANKEILICGLVGYQPIHESNKLLINFINQKDGKIKILIANTDSNYFRERTKIENDSHGRLIAENNSTIEELISIIKELKIERRNNIRVKLYTRTIKDVSFQIIDEREMLVNQYDISNGNRGYFSPMFKVTNERLAQKITFNHFFELFWNSWNDDSSNEFDLLNLCDFSDKTNKMYEGAL